VQDNSNTVAYAAPSTGNNIKTTNQRKPIPVGMEKAKSPLDAFVFRAAALSTL
jgi:hypothetical protein